MANNDPRGQTPWLKSINWQQPPGELRVVRQPPTVPLDPGQPLEHLAVTRRPGGHDPLNPRPDQGG